MERKSLMTWGRRGREMVMLRDIKGDLRLLRPPHYSYADGVGVVWLAVGSEGEMSGILRDSGSRDFREVDDLLRRQWGQTVVNQVR